VRPFKVSLVVAILMLFLCPPLPAHSQASKDNAQAAGAVSTYLESQAGLRGLIQDMLNALTSGNTEKMDSYCSGLTIPDHSAWFEKVFGPDEGARLDAKYSDLLPRVPSKLSLRFSHALDGQMNDVSISVSEKAANSSGILDRAIFAAMQQPVPIYRANGIGPIYNSGSPGPMSKFPIYLGDFVFVDGAFRYIDSEVFDALSTAPPLRIRQGGNVTAATIIYQPAPRYPDKARADHVEGSVFLHIIVDKDGAVKNLEVINGDPLLVNAAMDAVKQWRYKPTLLNGKPVEVDTVVTVTFRLNN
jgi:TonB family protein